jgi:uncharacterized protein
VKVVLDTNVLVAAFGTRGLCEAVYQVCLAKHEVVISEHILKEVHRGLCGKMKVDPGHAGAIVASLRETSTLVVPAKVPANACRDASDLPVLGTVLAGEASVLVTGDQDLLKLKEFHSVPILTPRVFHDSLG